VLGWLNWLGAESIGVVVAVLNLLWVPVVAFIGIAIPDTILTIPIVAVFAVTLAHFITLYRARVPITVSQTAIAALAAMSVQLTVAKAVGDGLIKDHLPFARTAKGGTHKRALAFQAFWEAVLGGLLVTGALTLIVTNGQNIREIYIFAGVLLIQSLPFLSAVVIAALEGSRFNDFAYWSELKPRLAGALSRQPAVAGAAAPAEKRVETVQ
jgi:hypothetical protein